MLFIVLVSNLSAQPFVPKSKDAVLEQLVTDPFDPELRILRQLRAAVNAAPNDSDAALQLARAYIQRGRRLADPRYLSYAEAALQKFWSGTNSPPSAVLVMRATLRQTNHDFENALRDLDVVLREDPGNAQAWLTRATILQVLGRFSEARQACLPLVRLTSELVAVTAAASVASLTGNGANSYDLLLTTFERHTNAPPAEKAWTVTALAEIAARLGRTKEAEAHFKSALKANPEETYLLGSYADLLLDERRNFEVLDLLTGRERADGLLLRLTLAQAALEPSAKRTRQNIDSLQARFQASRARGDKVHLREEARFTLHLAQDPVKALDLALMNWGIQKEPWDARLVLEASLAAKNVKAAQLVLQWLADNRLEDVQIARLVARASQPNL